MDSSSAVLKGRSNLDLGDDEPDQPKSPGVKKKKHASGKRLSIEPHFLEKLERINEYELAQKNGLRQRNTSIKKLYTSKDALEKLDRSIEKSESKQTLTRRQNGVFVSGSQVSLGFKKPESFDRMRGLNPVLGANNDLSSFLSQAEE